MASDSTGLTEWFTCPMLGCPEKLPLMIRVSIQDDRAVVTAWGKREQVINLTASVRILNTDALIRHLSVKHADATWPILRGLGIGLHFSQPE